MDPVTRGNIVLTGFMGTGKTATGQLLASTLHLPFVDTDREVEAAAGMTCAEIFSRFGEQRFRSEESLAVARVAQREGCVIATGGGVVLNPDNMRRLRSRGVIILLAARPEVIAGRIGSSDGRPLLLNSDRSPEQMLEKIKSLLESRAPLYADCDLRIDTSDTRPSQTVAEIMLFLKEQGWQSNS